MVHGACSERLTLFFLRQLRHINEINITFVSTANKNMVQEKEIVSLVKGLYNTIQKVGLKKVLNKLNELNAPTFSDYENEIKDYIIKKTCEVYGLSFDDLKKKHIRGEKVTARTMCFCQMKKHLNFSHDNIAEIFGRGNHTIVSLALKDFAYMKGDVKSDKDFIDKYKVIDNDIVNFKQVVFLKYKMGGTDD